jgi:8-oxo-dGTP diphosphatase
MSENALFFVGQKAFIEKDGEVLVLNGPYGLDFPGGRIQEGETTDSNDRNELISALKREVLEETNLEIEVFDPFFNWFQKASIKSKNYGKTIYLVGFKCKYLSGELKLSDEHDNFQWVNKDNYKKLDNRGDYFLALEKYFSL